MKVCLKSNHNFAKSENVHFGSLQVGEIIWHWYSKPDKCIICDMDMFFFSFRFCISPFLKILSIFCESYVHVSLAKKYQFSTCTNFNSKISSIMCIKKQLGVCTTKLQK